MSENEIPTDGAAISSDSISDSVGKLLEHPELLSMVASVLGKPSPVSASQAQAGTADISDDAEAVVASNTESTPSVGDVPDVMASVMPLLSRVMSGKGNCRHEQLLCALKPYLSPSRCQAIDYVIKISQMSSLVKGLK